MTDGLEEIGLPPIGHNKPPPYEPSDAALKLFGEADALLAHAERWKAERPEFTDGDMAAAGQLTIDQLRAVMAALDSERKAAAKPHDEAITIIDARFTPTLDRLKECVTSLREKATVWLKRERDRLAAASDPARPRLKGDYSRRAMGLRSNWKARIIDEQAALRHYAKHPVIRAAALAAIRKVASDEAVASKGSSKPPPGCEFFNDERAV